MKLTDPGYLIGFFEGYFCHNNVIDSPSDMSSLEPLTFQIKHFREGHFSCGGAPGPNVVEMIKWAIPGNVPLGSNAPVMNSFHSL